MKVTIQFVINTRRFQLKATLADDTGVVEGADEEVGDREEVIVAQQIGRSDNDIGPSL